MKADELYKLIKDSINERFEFKYPEGVSGDSCMNHSDCLNEVEQIVKKLKLKVAKKTVNETAIKVEKILRPIFQERFDERYKYVEVDKKSLQECPFEYGELEVVLEDLDGAYKNTEIAIACGYYTINQKGEKVADIERYKTAREEAGVPMKEDSTALALAGDDGYEIFNGRICIIDYEHGGTIFIPKRIVEKKSDPSNNYDDFEDCDLNWIKNESYKSDMSDQEAKEALDMYGFTEPMMWFTVNNHYYVDSELVFDDSFTYEELAEYYGFEFGECHKNSRWSDG